MYRFIFFIAYFAMDFFLDEVSELRIIRGTVFIGILMVIALLERILTQIKKSNHE